MKEFSKYISSFAYLYAASVCAMEGMEQLEKNDVILASVCFVSCFFATLAVFRFQVAGFIYWCRDRF
ncbi:MAG: hypothetical protein CMM25_07825 [Rhodospirillaceae bacterium]|nr:hypothetical protein [Rhodospirillaceae bacterium]|tara:strand:- start:946 stop:1146 length:201 start_codon:yes stop_codon:yes gene_type:complete